MTVKNADVEKSKSFLISELIDYVPHAVVMKTILNKYTGNVTAISFDSGQYLPEKISPFDTLIQIIEGSADILIDDHSQTLETGESIIVPAHSKNAIKANKRFKMISTIIKSGYE
ncbi:MAG: cupin domain-containing protein [Eubacteriaceae bacterium]|nr:cupin domain-containing protein [Eubacteriaceae bacterium]